MSWLVAVVTGVLIPSQDCKPDRLVLTLTAWVTALSH
jgi:hypothetical protein